MVGITVRPFVTYTPGSQTKLSETFFLDSQFRYKRLGLALLNLISTTKDGLENQTLNDQLAWCWRENCAGKEFFFVI